MRPVGPISSEGPYPRMLRCA